MIPGRLCRSALIIVNSEIFRCLVGVCEKFHLRQVFTARKARRQNSNPTTRTRREYTVRHSGDTRTPSPRIFQERCECKVNLHSCPSLLQERIGRSPEPCTISNRRCNRNPIPMFDGILCGGFNAAKLKPRKLMEKRGFCRARVVSLVVILVVL
jgi:hypothetical protein